MQVLYYIRALFSRDIPLHRPYTGLIYGYWLEGMDVRNSWENGFVEGEAVTSQDKVRGSEYVLHSPAGSNLTCWKITRFPARFLRTCMAILHHFWWGNMMNHDDRLLVWNMNGLFSPSWDDDPHDPIRLIFFRGVGWNHELDDIGKLCLHRKSFADVVYD